MWFIGVEVEQETSAPPPKKNPGSAPDLHTQLPLLAVPRNVSSLKPCWLLAIFVLFLRQERQQGKKNSRFKFKFISRLQK